MAIHFATPSLPHSPTRPLLPLHVYKPGHTTGSRLCKYDGIKATIIAGL